MATDEHLVGAEQTVVALKPFKPSNLQTVEAYLQTGDSLDKAGSYGLQTGAAALVDHIEGAYDTVLGLPTKLLATYLKQFDVPASPVVLDCPVRVIS